MLPNWIDFGYLKNTLKMGGVLSSTVLSWEGLNNTNKLVGERLHRDSIFSKMMSYKNDNDNADSMNWRDKEHKNPVPQGFGWHWNRHKSHRHDNTLASFNSRKRDTSSKAFQRNCSNIPTSSTEQCHMAFQRDVGLCGSSPYESDWSRFQQTFPPEKSKLQKCYKCYQQIQSPFHAPDVDTNKCNTNISDSLSKSSFSECVPKFAKLNISDRYGLLCKTSTCSLETVGTESVLSTNVNDLQESESFAAETRSPSETRNPPVESETKAEVLVDWFSYDGSSETVIDCSSQNDQSTFSNKVLDAITNSAVHNEENMEKVHISVNSLVTDLENSDGDKIKATDNCGDSTISNASGIVDSACSHPEMVEPKSNSCKKSASKSSSQEEVSVDGENTQKNMQCHILFIRSDGKKRRPSSKKRRRLKAKQSTGNSSNIELTVGGKYCAKENSDSCPQDKSRESAKMNTSESCRNFAQNAKYIPPKHGAVAFILGIKPGPVRDYDGQSGGSEDAQSFCISFSDSDSDFSDCNENDINEDLADLLPCTQDPFSPMNFRVRCSIQPQSSTNSELDNINMSWRINIQVADSEKPKKVKKKVHFPEGKDIATVHHMVSWCHAYSASRSGPWEEYARDRERFERRIAETENIILPVLQSEHRKYVYQKYFNKSDLV